MSAITTVDEKVLNACHRLNAEAYEQQVLTNGKQLKHFVPCAKAEMLMEVMRKGKHFGQAHANAGATLCACHSSLTEAGLMDYEYDPTLKLANYAHDYKTLYPRLYK
jgi:hypothetical protein